VENCSSRNKDCCVGQSMPFSVISTTRPSAEDNRTTRKSHGLSGSIVQPFVEWKRFNTFSAPGRSRSNPWGQRGSVSQQRQKGKKHASHSILLALIVVGVLLWLVNRFIPMAGSIKSI